MKLEKDDLSKLGIGQVVLTYFSESHSGVTGYVWVKLNKDKYMCAARIDAPDTIVSLLRSLTYNEDQVGESHRIELGNIDNVPENQIINAIKHIF